MTSNGQRRETRPGGPSRGPEGHRSDGRWLVLLAGLAVVTFKLSDLSPKKV